MPTAIFDASYSTKIIKHHFELKPAEQNGQRSVEEVFFEGGKTLTIFQSGCDQIEQSFQWSGWEDADFQSPEIAFVFIASAMKEYANLNKALFGYLAWANVFDSLPQGVRWSEPVEVDKGVWISINKDKAPEGTQLTLKIWNQNS